METGVKDDYFQNSDDQKIYCRYWNEDRKEHVENPKALVFICHGACEHCLWYDHVAASLISIGCYVFAHDHLGHGKSDGDRMYVRDFSYYIRDVFAHIEKVKSRFPSAPVFIVGHSMGGSIAILAGMEKPDYFKGIVLLGPAVLPSYPPTYLIQRFGVRVVAKICPRMRVAALDSSGTCSDPLVVQKYLDDPLVFHGKMTAKFLECFFDALHHIKKNSRTVEFPFLTMHGTADMLTGGSEHLYNTAASKDKSLKLYKDQLHQIHNEPDGVGESVIQEFTKWIEERM